jgi:hypothetical protein
MRRMATILSVLLAASTAASAQPWYGNRPVDRDQRGYDRRTDEGYRRGDEGYRPNGRIGNWVMLLERYATTSDRQFIPLGAHFGRLHRVRIEGSEGAPFIHKVSIQFLDGTWQNAEIEGRLPAGQGIEVPLSGGGRRVNRIVIYTEPDYQSSYSVMAD